AAFAQTREDLLRKAAEGEGEARDAARLDLAQFYLANRFAHEALGVLRVLEHGLSNDEELRKVRIAQAVGNTLAGRPREAITILQSPLLSADVDSVLWRAIARTEISDFRGAREDAKVAEAVLDSYP